MVLNGARNDSFVYSSQETSGMCFKCVLDLFKMFGVNLAIGCLDSP